MGTPAARTTSTNLRFIVALVALRCASLGFAQVAPGGSTVGLATFDFTGAPAGAQSQIGGPRILFGELLEGQTRTHDVVWDCEWATGTPTCPVRLRVGPANNGVRATDAPPDGFTVCPNPPPPVLYGLEPPIPWAAGGLITILFETDQPVIGLSYGWDCPSECSVQPPRYAFWRRDGQLMGEIVGFDSVFHATGQYGIAAVSISNPGLFSCASYFYIDNIRYSTSNFEGTPLLRIEDQLPPAQGVAEAPRQFLEHVPVAPFNGEVRLTVTDLRVPSRGIDFEFTRTYSSKADAETPIGHNWLLSYDRQIAEESARILRLDSNARVDEFQGTPSTNYTPPPQVFTSISQQTNGTFIETEPDGKRFFYDSNRRLTEIRDRNNNSMTIQRNEYGHITRIVDTQGRYYDITYTDSSPSQMIQTLTDCAGREVSYVYDEKGDLVAVRSPAIVNTPNGNNFPNGKTTRYEYSACAADSRMNHNLVAVYPPSASLPGQNVSALRFTYGSSAPGSLTFDRVVSAAFGSATGGGPASDLDRPVGGTVTLTYSNDVSGDADAPLLAARSTLVVDANGNRTTRYFDASGHGLRTIEWMNRDVRTGEERHVRDYAYTQRGLLSEVTYPRGNTIAYSYDDASPEPRSRGNVLERRRTRGSLPSGNDIVERLEYETQFNTITSTTDPRAFSTGVVPVLPNGHLNLTAPTVQRFTTVYTVDSSNGNVTRIDYPTIQTAGPNMAQAASELRSYNAHGQLTSTVDPEQHVTSYSYYPGNGVPGDASDREGYVHQIIVDPGASPPHLDTQRVFAYDLVGNVTAVTDGRGHTEDRQYNTLNQVVRMTSRELSGGIRYQTDYYYDLNDNLLEQQSSNLDHNGTSYPHSSVRLRFEYDILGGRCFERADVSRNEESFLSEAVTELRYDSNRNLVARREPEAVAGTQPTNTTTYSYDERDLLFTVTQGDDDLDAMNLPPDDATVVAHNYDGNRNLIEIVDRLRDARHPQSPTTIFPGTPNTGGDVQAMEFDSFDRLTNIRKPEGSVISRTYDLASHVIGEATFGPTNHAAGAPAGLLASYTHVVDERGRVVIRDVLHQVTLTGVPVGDGQVSTTYAYDRDGNVLSTTNDRGATTQFAWDPAHRLVLTTDAMGNRDERGYDANGNVVSDTHVDVSSATGPIHDSFTTTNEYDELDRLRRVVRSDGSALDYRYDSRSNRVRAFDGVNGTLPGAGVGNEVEYEFDASNRLLAMRRTITDNGRGNGVPVLTDAVVTRQEWDRSSRVVRRTDGEGNSTSYTYDGRGLLISTVDCRRRAERRKYDGDGRLISIVDRNGTAVSTRYDGENRPIRSIVSRAHGVGGCIGELYGYDGLGRLTFSSTLQRFNGLPDPVVRTYDTLGLLVSESQRGRIVASQHDGQGNRTSLSYPAGSGSGTFTVDCVYDTLDRLSDVSATGLGSFIAYEYRGAHRLSRKLFAGAAAQDVYYDAFPRPIDVSVVPQGAGAAFHWSYGYDRMGNLSFEKRQHDGDRGDVFGYDSSYRLVRHLADQDLSSVASGTDLRHEMQHGPWESTYDYDRASNRALASVFADQKLTVFTYVAACRNEYEQWIERSSQANGVVTRPTYDANGNMVFDGRRRYAYDYRNRLVSVLSPLGVLEVAFEYDSFDRRTGMFVAANNRHTDYLYDGDKCIAEFGAGTLSVRRVWGRSSRELLAEHRSGATQFCVQDINANVVLTTTTQGDVVESYLFDPFGEPRGGAGGHGSISSTYLFHCARRDPETGLYAMGPRMYSPQLGRFLQGDPLGPWGDERSTGNAYAFAGNSPVSWADPSGLESESATQEPETGFTQATPVPVPAPTPEPDVLEGSVMEQFFAESKPELDEGAVEAVDVFETAAAIVAPVLFGARALATEAATSARTAAVAARAEREVLGEAMGVLREVRSQISQYTPPTGLRGLIGNKALAGKINTSIEPASEAAIDLAGRSFVGEGAATYENGIGLVSQDRNALFRFPKFKNQGGTSANFQVKPAQEPSFFGRNINVHVPVKPKR